ncbi:MAG: hypothetical protein JO130_09230 [Solirubrobacterales bacterium]|nr:hypothetical protein [Solirubrobacterales bacterium]
MTAEAAAALLGTSPTILKLWEKRFGYPVSMRSTDGQSHYADEVMLALHDALSRELSIPSAIRHARRLERLPAPVAAVDRN